MDKLNNPISLVRLCLALLPKRLGGIFIEEEYNYQENKKYEYFKDAIILSKSLFTVKYSFNNFCKIIAYKNGGREEFLLILFDIKNKYFFKYYLEKDKYPDIYSYIYYLHLITKYIKNETVIKIKINQLSKDTIRFINGTPHYNKNSMKVVEYISHENGWINKILVDRLVVKCYDCGSYVHLKSRKPRDEIIDNGYKIIKFNYGFCSTCIYNQLECIRCCRNFHDGYCEICSLCRGINHYTNKINAENFLKLFKCEYYVNLSNKEQLFIKSFCKTCVETRFNDIKNKFIPSKFKKSIHGLLKFLNMEEQAWQFHPW